MKYYVDPSPYKTVYRTNGRDTWYFNWISQNWEMGLSSEKYFREFISRCVPVTPSEIASMTDTLRYNRTVILEMKKHCFYEEVLNED
jgi:hypothetical protein